MSQTIDLIASPDRESRAPLAATGLPPVILIGGEANALSVARSLGRLGARVHLLNRADSPARFSRHGQWLRVAEDDWARFLLGPESEALRGAVVLACSDAGITLLALHREALAARYRLDLSDPVAQVRMLDKLSTYTIAERAGVPTPRVWQAGSRADVEALRGSLCYPLLVKPRLSHLFERKFGRKYVMVYDYVQLLRAFDAARAAGLDVLLMEWIPGGDDRLCSYYTYLDADGEPLVHFTKRIIRRYPVAMGTACYHVTDWDPEARDLGLRLFREAGLRGLANVEFKRDERDGQLKLIECNARFTASNGLVADSGLDLAALVYRRLVGLPQPPPVPYTRGLRLWDPVRDFQAFLELRRDGALTFRAWAASVLHRQTFPYFRWSDPLPALVRASKPLRSWLFRSRP